MAEQLTEQALLDEGFETSWRIRCLLACKARVQGFDYNRAICYSMIRRMKCEAIKQANTEQP